MKKTDQRLIKSLFFVFTFLFVFGSFTFADEVIKVAIFPFQINSAENLDYVKQGVGDMLSSRISVAGKVRVLENARVNEALSQTHEDLRSEEVIKKIGGELGVDFILAGSLTKIGERISIDAKVFDLKKKAPLMSLFAVSLGMDNVIPEINDLALKANARITGKAYREHSTITPAVNSEASEFISETLSPEAAEKGEEK